MRGRIIGFDPTTFKGAINGHDGQRYDFVMQDWRGGSPPRVNAEVDFQLTDSHARDIFPVKGEAAPTSLLNFYFSFHGRIRRRDYWLKGVLLGTLFSSILIIAAALLDVGLGDFNPNLPQGDPNMGAPFFSILTYLFIAFWPGLALQVKRWHDRDKSGFFVLVNFIPFAGAIWSFVEVGCLRGTEGDNRFGPDPVTD